MDTNEQVREDKNRSITKISARITAPVISAAALLVACIALTLIGAMSTDRDEALVTLGMALGTAFGFVIVVLPYAVDGLRAELLRRRTWRQTTSHTRMNGGPAS